MYGPSEVYGMHHRSARFKAMMDELDKRFRDCYNLPEEEWAICFITGNGTIANEMVIKAFGISEILGDPTANFTKRLYDYRESRAFGVSPKLRGCVHYETYTGEIFDESQLEEGELIFADMISGFPYYDIPDYVGVFTAVTGKQLMQPPGLAIIGVRTSLVDQMYGALAYNESQDLATAIGRHKIRKAPHTPAISLLYKLNEWLRYHCGDVRRNRILIQGQRRYFEAIVPKKYRPDTDKGPVFSVNAGILSDEFVERFQIYRVDGCPHFFLHNDYGGDERGPMFLALADEIRQHEHKGTEQ